VTYVNLSFFSGTPRRASSEANRLYAKLTHKKPTAQNLLKINMILSSGLQLLKIPAWYEWMQWLTLRSKMPLCDFVSTVIMFPAGQLPVGGLQSICEQRGND
jgi:hypothetical protein